MSITAAELLLMSICTPFILGLFFTLNNLLASQNIERKEEPKDKWGADTHEEEFGHEYDEHHRPDLKEPSVNDKGWDAETHDNPGDWDPHGKDAVTNSSSPAKKPVKSAVVKSAVVQLSVFSVAVIVFFFH